MVERIIERNGCSLHYWIDGADSAPWVIFTHGAGVDHREFDATLPVIVKAGYRVLAWDVRGHGRSRPAAFSPLEAVSDLTAILDASGAHGDLLLVGHSMGGSLSQEFAFRFPGRVQAMAMLDCAWNYQKVARLDEYSIKLAAPILKLYPYNLLVDTMASISTDSAEGRVYLKEVFGALGKEAFIAVISNILDFLRHEPDYVFGKPMLMLVGDKDTTGNIRRTAAAWAKHEPQSELRIIPKAKHAWNFDQPDLFHKYLIDFLQRHRAI